MLRTGYIFILAILFVGIVLLLKQVHFWAAVGLSEPAGYLWQGFLFLALLWILQTGLFGPYLRTLEERENQTVHKMQRAEAVRQDAEGMVTKYRAQLEDARHRGTREREHLALAAEAEEKQQLAQAKSESQEDFQRAVQAFASEQKAAHAQLQSAQANLAQEILTQVLRKPVAASGGQPRLVSMEAKKGS